MQSRSHRHLVSDSRRGRGPPGSDSHPQRRNARHFPRIVSSREMDCAQPTPRCAARYCRAHTRVLRSWRREYQLCQNEDVVRGMHAILDADDPSLFPKLAAEQLTLLARYGQVKPIQVGDVLFREGDTAYDLMVLLEGRVAVVVGSGDAQRQLVCHRPGDVMADLSILTREPVHAAGVVKEPGSMLVVPAEEFRALLGRELAFGDFILQTL